MILSSLEERLSEDRVPVHRESSGDFTGIRFYSSEEVISILPVSAGRWVRRKTRFPRNSSLFESFNVIVMSLVWASWKLCGQTAFIDSLWYLNTKPPGTRPWLPGRFGEETGGFTHFSHPPCLLGRPWASIRDPALGIDQCFSRDSWLDASSLCSLHCFGRVYPKNRTASPAWIPSACIFHGAVQCHLTEEATFCRSGKKNPLGFGDRRQQLSSGFAADGPHWLWISHLTLVGACKNWASSKTSHVESVWESNQIKYLPALW